LDNDFGCFGIGRGDGWWVNSASSDSCDLGDEFSECGFIQQYVELGDCVGAIVDRGGDHGVNHYDFNDTIRIQGMMN